MYIYLIKNPAGEVLAVNRTIHGTAMELYGLNIEIINGESEGEKSLEKAFVASARVECKTSAGEKIITERHFLGN